jgi:tetratricopeptide (TPR) repeat protein
MIRDVFLPCAIVVLSLSLMSGSALAQKNNTDNRIRFFQWKVSQDPDDGFNYDHLGTALIQKARETGDIAYFDLAATALEKSLSLDSTHPEAGPATKHLATVYFSEHRFAEARDLARKALQLNPQDSTPYALIGDAESEMGNYDAAWAVYRRLENPANSQAGNESVLYLQETRVSSEAMLTGDTQSSIEHMERAVEISRRAGLATESVAWSQFMLGEDYFLAGDLARAKSAYGDAQQTYPGYHRALAWLAKIAAAQGRFPEAIDEYQQAIRVIPLPAYVASLGDAYARNGQAAEAQKQYDLVEYIARLTAFNQSVYNRELAVFYADHNIHPDQALALARREFEVRHDVYTWDALAWALYRNGRVEEAARAIHSALQLGTKDASIFFHAGLICAALNETDEARNYLDRVQSLNPHFNPLFEELAAQSLAGVSGGTTASASGQRLNGRLADALP